MSTFPYENILIVNTFGIGDVLFTTPLVANIKRECPDARLGYVANQRTADVLRSNPQIDDVFVYERDEFNELYRRSRIDFVKKVKAFLKEIRSHQYDAVLDLSLNTPTGFFMKLAGITTRIGYDYKGRGKFLTQKIPLAGYDGKHVVSFYLDLLKKLGFDPQESPMTFPISEGAQKRAEDIFQQHNIKGRMATIVPGGGASWGKDSSRKQWAPEKFAQLADRLAKDCKATVVLAGGPDDKGISRKISQQVKQTVVNLAGDLTLEQSAALFAKSDLVIANDGGPLHIAVAAGAKTVSIFGPVDERVYGPYPAAGHRTVVSDIACRPCYRRFRVAECGHISCLRDLSVEKVFEVVKGIL